MTETKTVIRKKVEGQVLYNDGEFAEIQTNGIEGIEEGVLLETIQTHRGDTSDLPEEFQRRFPVGMRLEIMTTTRDHVGSSRTEFERGLPPMSAASIAAVAATCNFEGRPSVRAPEQLRIHPALRELGWPEVEELNNADQLTQQLMPDPILISSSGTILAGFALWQLAVMERRMEIHCIEYPLNDDEALQFILRHHQIRRGWNAFVRICLALRLEAYFQQKALDNMRAGGKHKGSAILPDVQRIDVREQIASVAGACPRYVSNVKTIVNTAHPRVIAALRDGRMTINRAMGLSQLTKAEQIELLTRYFEDREINKVVRHSVTRPQGKETSCPEMSTLLGAIQRQELRQPGSTVVRLGRLQCTVILVGRDLLTRSLAQSELKLV